MSVGPDDPIWPEFEAIWPALREIGGDSLLVGGGYALILKQTWLRTHLDIRTVVPVERWRDPAPRVTKDLDIVVGLDLICSEDGQARLSRVLNKNHFKVTDRNPRWQFKKELGQDRRILVEFHSPLPEQGETHLKTDKVRVKHHPSLGENGIHGRQNPEAVGADINPFSFELDGVTVTIPNPVTLCNMKLTAMRDRKRKADDPARDEEHREFQRKEAIKHAQDVCRAVAMCTRDESDRASRVLQVIRNAYSFKEATSIFDEFFGRNEGWAMQAAVRPMYQSADAATIRDVLSDWFRLPS